MKLLPRHNYYEGILQLREIDESVADFVVNDIEKYGDECIKITKAVKLKNGLDLYITSKKYLQKIARKLVAHFGGEYNISPQLFTKDRHSGKEVYRLNVLFKMPEYKKGEAIIADNRLMKVVTCAKRITCINMKTLKKTIVERNKDVQRIDEVFTTMVTKIKPYIEVLDPETYQSVQPMNQAKVVPGQKVRVVKVNNAIWLL